jgi:kynurenine formamidase
MGATQKSLSEQLEEIVTNANFVDLSHTIAEELPAAWPTHMPLQIRIWNYFVEQNEGLHYVKSSLPFQTRWMTLDEHCGTHFDAPPHFVPPSKSGLPNANKWGDMSGEKVPLQQMIGPAAVLDCTQLDGKAGPGESPLLEVTFVKEWENRFGEIKGNEIVTFWSGWDKHYVKGPDGDHFGLTVVQGKSPGWVAPSKSTIDYLFDKGVRCLATDGASVGAAHRGVETHLAGLGRGMVYIEALANLNRLPARGAYLFFLPLKIKGSTGSPGRAFALVPKVGSES